MLLVSPAAMADEGKAAPLVDHQGSSITVAERMPEGAAAVSQETSVANPSVGIGLSGVVDYSSQLPFIDLMKTARGWTGHVGGGWGGMSDRELKDEGYLDARGWPMRMPQGVTGIATLILTDLPEEATSVNGRYRLRYEGQGLIEITSRGQTVTGTRGEAWFTAKPGEGAVILTIIRTDPNGTGDYLRNFSIVKEENIAAFEAGEVFNPAWINRIKQMRAVRFMDWMATNDSAESEWADRPKPDDYTYTAHGVPLEVMIQLANEIGVDPWFNIPHLATDDYIREFATMVRDELDPRLKAYVELSNEVWNWQFSQARWAEDNGKARWGQESKWVQFYALRASEMVQIWDEVYGAEAKQRLVKVLATQTGWLGLEEDILTAPMWTAESPDNKPPYAYFDAYAITGYFSALLGNDKAETVLGWIEQSRRQALAEAQDLDESLRADYVTAHEYDLAIELAAQELGNGGVTGNQDDSVARLVETIFPYHAAVAHKYGLDLVMYEGGTHVVGIGQWTDSDELTQFFEALNYSPAMGALYGEVMDGWRKAGGTLFNAFVDVSKPSKWGSWGGLRTLDDSNPRWDAIERFNLDNPGWWEERVPGTFERP